MENQSTEDYLKGIYLLQTGGKNVPTSTLAKHLKIGDGSVTDMLKKLAEKGLINYEPYQGVTLAPKGERLALKMVRRHRLWEVFLVRFLGYSWDEIHGEAERLEHVTSDAMADRLDKALGYPKFDPHGHPIPDSNGVVESVRSESLAVFDAGTRLEIVRVSDDDSDVLHHAARLGMTLNSIITIKEKMKFDGSMVVVASGQEQFVSQRVAQAIFVEPAEEG